MRHRLSGPAGQFNRPSNLYRRSGPAYSGSCRRVTRKRHSQASPGRVIRSRHPEQELTMNGKIALITGANRGLGKNTAQKLAKKGVGIIATYRHNAAEADALVKDIVSAGGKAVALQLDVSQAQTFAAFATQVSAALKATFGRERFDFLVNNAGN